MGRRVAAIASGVIALALLFQLFFRYQYIHTVGNAVMRVDRVTGATCYLPCLPPTPVPKETPTESPAVREQHSRDAISLVKASASRQVVTNDTVNSYEWSADQAMFHVSKDYVDIACGFAGEPSPTAAERKKDPNAGFDVYWQTLTRCVPETQYYVSYSKQNGHGWFWEVHLDTRQVYYILDDKDLMFKYGLRRD